MESDSFDIGAAGTLSLATVAASQRVDFMSASGELDLHHAADFEGTISSWTHGDKIDLVGLSVTGVSFAGGVLDVVNGKTTIAKIHFSGDYTSASFSFASDGAHGTIIY